MAYIVKACFDDGSKKGGWLIGEEYNGPNGERLLADGLVVEKDLPQPKPKAKKKAESKKAE